MGKSLSASQMDLVYSDENILCCATAGSGKTSSLAEKVKQVLRTHPDPWIILATFSRDAANEMAARIRHSKITPPINPAMLRRVNFGTYHSLALSQLRKAGKAQKILSSLELRHAVMRSLWDMRMKLSADEAVELIACCKSNPQFAQENPDLADLSEIYQGHLESMNGMDFTDILLRANRLMALGKQAPLRATHIMADEYQDTDAIQAEWLEHHMLPGRIACAVGDDDQSIYAFRRSLGYGGMKRFISATKARIIRLDTNYRSTSGIVFSAGRLIEKNCDRIKKDFKVARGDGLHPNVLTIVKGGDDQPTAIMNRILDLCRGNPMTAEERKEFAIAVPVGEVAILSRTNVQLDAMEDACRRMSIPFNRSGSLFWDIKVLQVFLMLLQSLDIREGSGLEIGLRWAGLNDKALSGITSGGNLWSLASPAGPALPNTMTPAALKLLGFYRTFSPNRDGERPLGARAAINGIAAWMKTVLARGNHLATAAGTSSPSRPPSAARLNAATESALKVLEIGRSSLQKYEGSLSTRLKKVQSSTSSKDKSGVTLSTFHSSKGLEWRHVFLTDIDGGSVPSPEAKAPPLLGNFADRSPEEAEQLKAQALIEALEEERRIFFVAMTRARDSLTLVRNDELPVSEFLIDANLYPVAN